MSKVFPLLKFPSRSWNAMRFWVFFISDESPPCYSRAKYNPNQQFITIKKITKWYPEWLTSVQHKRFSTLRKLGSQASFTLNGKCTLPSCGQNINNTEIYSRRLLSLEVQLIPNWSWPTACHHDDHSMQFGILALNDLCQQIRGRTWRNGSLLRKLWITITRETWGLI